MHILDLMVGPELRDINNYPLAGHTGEAGTEPSPTAKSPLFRRPESWPEIRFVADALRTETVGGLLLIGATVVALIWANSPWRESYEALKSTVVGPAALHLDLDLATWAADGLLAVFFFVVGLELKRELTEGDLRDPRRAVVPVIAALGGVAIPALLYVLVNLGPEGSLDGWAIPTATDIAFALAVLAVLGSHLPAGLRSFLLTLAVVDDLVAILIIAVFFTAAVDLAALAGALGLRGRFRLAGPTAAPALDPRRSRRGRRLGVDARLRRPRHHRRSPARSRRPVARQGR